MTRNGNMGIPHLEMARSVSLFTSSLVRSPQSPRLRREQCHGLTLSPWRSSDPRTRPSSSSFSGTASSHAQERRASGALWICDRLSGTPASRGCLDSRSRRITRQRPGVRELHQSGQHRGRQVQRFATDPLRADPASRFDFLWPAASGSSPSRLRITAATWHAARLPVHRHGRRRRRDDHCIAQSGSCSARCEWRIGPTAIRATTSRQSICGQAGVLRKSGAWVCGIHGAGASTTPRAAPKALVIGMSAKISKRSTTRTSRPRPGRGPPGATARGLHNNVTCCRRSRYRSPIDLRVGRSFGGRLRVGSCIAAPPDATYAKRAAPSATSSAAIWSSSYGQQRDRSRQRGNRTVEFGAAARSPASLTPDAHGKICRELWRECASDREPNPCQARARHRPPGAPVVGIAIPRARRICGSHRRCIRVGTGHRGDRFLVSRRWRSRRRCSSNVEHGLPPMEDEAACALLLRARRFDINRIWRQRPRRNRIAQERA